MSSRWSITASASCGAGRAPSRKAPRKAAFRISFGRLNSAFCLQSWASLFFLALASRLGRVALVGLGLTCLGLFAALHHCLCDAAVEVLLQQSRSAGLERGVGGGDLGEDVDAARPNRGPPGSDGEDVLRTVWNLILKSARDHPEE